jgi:competence protein ComEA
VILPVNTNIKYVLVVIAFTTIGFSAGLYVSLPRDPPFPTRNSVVLSPADTGVTPPDKDVTVEIVGDGIEQTGTYELPADSEIIDLVNRVGGVSTGAITSGLNWHANLYEGLTLTLPTRRVFQDVRPGTRTLSNRDLIRFRSYNQREEPSETTSDLISLNEASRRELQELPGIGRVLSGRILDYREENNGFDHIRELKDVFGIGDVTYQELRAKVTTD